MTRAFIDLRKNGAPTPMLAAHVVERARRHDPPPLLLVAADHADAWRAVVDEQAQVWAEGTEQPPAPAPPPPAPVDLDAARAARKAALRDDLWGYVDEVLDPHEREALAALQQRCVLTLALGGPVDGEALTLLVGVLGWAESALAAWAALVTAVDAARSVEEVDAITVDRDALGRPPPVTASDIAARLRGG